MTRCATIPSTISGKLKVGVFLGGMVATRLKPTESSCKLSATIHSVCQHQNREDFHIFGWENLWEEEDNIVFDSYISCVIFAKMP